MNWVSLPGFATPEATRAYAKQHATDTGEGHFSELVKTRILLSSIGVGTFPGDISIGTDAEVARIVSRALQSGINVIDTAAHYRYGHALAAVGAGVRDAHAHGVPREAMYLISKGGFLTLRGGRPADFDAWFTAEIEAQGLGSRDDLAKNAHLISPAYIDYQLNLSRQLMGVATLDAFLIDQPEIHIAVIGKEYLNRKLLAAFEVLERACLDGRLRSYGISTFDGFRVETDHNLFQSLTSLQGLAQKAAVAATGNPVAPSHFLLGEMPFNQAMTEGFARFNQATGQGNVASTLQAGYQLGVYMLGSHGLAKGRLASLCTDAVAQTLPMLANDAQRSIQFNRSTPGLGTTLIGMSRQAQLDDLLAVARTAPMKRDPYLRMYEKT